MDGLPGEGIMPRVIKSYIDLAVSQRTAEFGISPSCCIFLCKIKDHEGASLQEFSMMLYVNKSLVTRNAKQLIEQGLVENRHSVRNKYSLYLTEKGSMVVEKVTRIVEDIWKEIFQGLTDEERECFRTCSMKMSENLKRMIERDGVIDDL